MLGPETRIFTTKGMLAAARAAGQILHAITWDGRITLVTIAVAPGRPAELVRIRFDDADDCDLEVSPEVEVLTRDLERVRAGELRVGASLLPFYTRRHARALEYFEPGNYFEGALAAADKQPWRPFIRMVLETKLGRRLEDGERATRHGPLDDYSPEHIGVQRARPVDPSLMLKKTLWYKLEQAKAFGEAHKDMLGPGRPPSSKILRPPPKNHKVAAVERGYCFGEGSLVYVIDSSIVMPLPIEQLALEDGAGRYVLGYDEKRKIICKTLVKHAWMTKAAAPILHVPVSNGMVLKVTPEHKLLTPEGGFVQAKLLNKAARLVSVSSGFNLKEKSVLTHNNPSSLWITDWHKPAREPVRIFDVETELGNLIVDGVVCHNSTAPLSITAMGSGNFSAGGVFISADLTQ